MNAHTTTRPPMDPDTDEADVRQLELASKQGDAYGAALHHMTNKVAHDGGEQECGHYLIGYAIEEAEGMYEWSDGKLTWVEPEDTNLHVEVSVRDAADGRFIPGLTVTATLVGPDGSEFGPHEHPMLWHPMINHYGRNWALQQDGEYRLQVHIDPPTFMRHDKVNGCRFTEPADVEFTEVQVQRGQD